MRELDEFPDSYALVVHMIWQILFYFKTKKFKIVQICHSGSYSISHDTKMHNFVQVTDAKISRPSSHVYHFAWPSFLWSVNKHFY